MFVSHDSTTDTVTITVSSPDAYNLASILFYAAERQHIPERRVISHELSVAIDEVLDAVYETEASNNDD